ncbi:MAG: NAD(P)-binding protein [Bacteroidota bacterium]|nr:NAD(P)-binding protein [Bacteroidota bacterium]
MNGKIAVIGGGLSGLTVANLLKNRYEVTVYEKESRPGGLIRCERVNGQLYHLCGGHVFNSKRQDVLDWFWNLFNRDEEFLKVNRNAVVCMSNGKIIPYPIENHAYLFDEEMKKNFIKDLVDLASKPSIEPSNFEEFLLNRFGKTLYKEYFNPYNKKIWKSDLRKIPMDWLDGKLPMPSIEEIIYNNINRIEEKKFVHSTFWYEKFNGSQFIVDRLSQGLNIICDNPVNLIEKSGENWIINNQKFRYIIFCGIIKDLPKMLKGLDISAYENQLNNLDYHGTTSVLCEINKNPYSWMYLPSETFKSHRIICTGNFSESNNADGKMTATIEFTDYISKEEILLNLEKMPLSPLYIKHHYNQYTYPIQDASTRMMIGALKKELSKSGFYLSGRFADWEYYNMDVAIGAAMDLCKTL